MQTSSLNKNICVSLTLGSTQTSLVVASCEQQFQILGATRVANNNAIKKGIVCSIDAVTASLLEAVDEVERQSGIEISFVRACISGTIGRFDNYIESISIKGEEIKSSDLDKMHSLVLSQKPPAGYDFIHLIPGLYTVDNKHGIQNPVGMKGSTLAILHHRIAYPQADLHNIVKACNSAGLKVQNFVFEPLAAAEGVLTPDEKEFGCLSLSIGAHLTHVCVYIGHVPVYTKEYPLGSYHVTKDLSIGLRTTQAEAERVKKELGKALDLRSHSNKEINEKISLSSIDNFTSRFVTRKEINQIIEPRAREILQTVYLDMQRSKLLTRLAKGVILSGGGVLLSSIATLTEEVFGLQARIGTPINIAGAVEGIRSPIWAATVGTLSNLFCSEAVENSRNKMKSETERTKWYDHLRKKMEGLFT